MIAEAKLPKIYWAEAINIACYTHNQSMLTKQQGKTPYEIWNGKKPRISYFHVNGKSQLKTFDSKSDEGIFLGYSKIIKAFRVYNCRTLIME